MAPPTYGDLGKSAKDVFGKGYHFSLLKLNVKTKTPSGVEFETGGSSNTESGKVAGSLETKYKCSDYGLTLTEKWSTDNQLATTVELADKPLAGAKLVFDSTFCPQSGAKSGKVKTSYKQDMVTLNADVDLNLGGPTVNASAVVGHQGWLGGYQMAFDTSKSQLTKNNFAIGYSAKDFTLHTNVNDGQVNLKNIDLKTGFWLIFFTGFWRICAPKGQPQFGDCCQLGMDCVQEWDHFRCGLQVRIGQGCLRTR